MAKAGATTTRRAYPKEGGGGRRHNRSAPSATSTRPVKDSQVLTVTVLQDASKRKVDEHGESPHPKHPYRGRLQGKGPPPTTSASQWETRPVQCIWRDGIVQRTTLTSY